MSTNLEPELCVIISNQPQCCKIFISIQSVPMSKWIPPKSFFTVPTIGDIIWVEDGDKQTLGFTVIKREFLKYGDIHIILQ